MHINFEGFVDSLRYMGIGLLGVFAVTAILIICVVVLNKLTEKKDNDTEKK